MDAIETTVGTARAFATSLLAAAGMPPAPAQRTAWALVTADVWGLGSHGLLRLPHYLRRFAAGGTDPAAELRVIRDTPATATYDGANGLGHWQVWHAAEVATAKATTVGIAAVAVGNSGHCGSLGLYVLPMVAAGQIGLVCSNGPAVMPPWNGRRPVLSTSPLAAGIPLPPPRRAAVVDLATTAIARGAIAQHQAAGKPLQPGWAFDSEGRPTVDAAAALAGMLAPMGGAKGYALAFLVEALTGGVIGPHLATAVADPLSPAASGDAQRIAHLVVALDPALLDVDGSARSRLSDLASQIEQAGGRLPGALRRFDDELAPAHPVTVAASTVDSLARAAAPLGITVPDHWLEGRR